MTAQGPWRPAILVTVRRSDGAGLTQEVEELLKNNPRTWFRLRDVLGCVRQGADKGAVQSILHKLVTKQGDVVKKLVDNERYGKNVRLLVAAYKWRLPSDARTEEAKR